MYVFPLSFRNASSYLFQPGHLEHSEKENLEFLDGRKDSIWVLDSVAQRIKYSGYVKMVSRSGDRQMHTTFHKITLEFQLPFDRI